MTRFAASILAALLARALTFAGLLRRLVSGVIGVSLAAQSSND